MASLAARHFCFFCQRCQNCEKSRKVWRLLMNGLKLTAIFEKADEGGYIGYVAELPGANTQGETIEETRENLRDAVSLLLECYRDEADARIALNSGSRKEDLILQAA